MENNSQFNESISTFSQEKTKEISSNEFFQIFNESLYVNSSIKYEINKDNIYYSISNNSEINISSEKTNRKIEEKNNIQNSSQKNIKFITQNLISKKRGRKAKNKKNQIQIHDKNSPDNLLSKIQVNFFSYIIFLCNDILKSIKEEKTKDEFKKLPYEMTKKVDNLTFYENLNSKIKDIIKEKISKKYKTFKENNNEIILNKLLNKEDCDKKLIWINDFFNLSLINIFHYYYNDNKDEPLKKIHIGKKKIIISDKTQKYSFYNLLKKKKNISSKQNLINMVETKILYNRNYDNTKGFFTTKNFN